ncbi:TrmJ/YjtD family RNA methyltransferase [Arsenophonus endosymbiont of Bemisia tabaci]|uniref:TrmJ/YjtD family RNA methyltransferase n=1 Tax=Arsenophonus endosymbiont of Bemisia tabaci TaxID=536059 RepID=UPI0015F6E6BF|nr:TrmJ/YjtD family RNA methyltransferase [Arsenophonus endosymbiont of Bemisia tabaci]CAA2929778.1 tRNA (cytidine/uridine-2'-O-)-methyltransferase TrmJ [Arsenophonus endosymbiont of Bemisia tabaci Q2]
MLKNIRIILVETSHTGNMGSTARAMKTMGVTNLYLVNPLVLPDAQAVALSAGASDVIWSSDYRENIRSSFAWMQLGKIGTSVRDLTLSWSQVTPRECGEKTVRQAINSPVAIIFGRERVGLRNEKLQRCQYYLHIPTNPEYGSLNLAMSVQLISYEIRMAYLAINEKNPW